MEDQVTVFEINITRDAEQLESGYVTVRRGPRLPGVLKSKKTLDMSP